MKALIAMSGGVDSSMAALLTQKEGFECIGCTMKLFENRDARLEARRTCCSLDDVEDARRVAMRMGIPYVVFNYQDAFQRCVIDKFVQSYAQGLTPNPCIDCNRFLKFDLLLQRAGELGCDAVVTGHYARVERDDNGDYRPGLTAVAELGIRSPLRACSFTKEDVRQMSRALGLPTWDKQSFACLSSRFPYGESITREKLGMVDRAEQLLLDLGFHQLRVRIHDKLARIELMPSEFSRFMEDDVRSKVHQALKEMGFTYVTLDIAGYRTGSMNETLTEEEKA